MLCSFCVHRFYISVFFVTVKASDVKKARVLKMIFALLASAIVLFTVWYQIKYYRRNRLLSQIPAVSSYPIIGSNLSFYGKSPQEIFQLLEKASEELGPVYRFDFSPFATTVMANDPKIIEDLLSSNTLIQKSIEYDYVRRWLGDG